MDIKQRPEYVTGTVNYYGANDEKYFYAGTVGEKRRKHTPKEVKIRDLRTVKEEEVTLDKQGFQLVQHESIEKLFDNDDRIRQIYYPECAELLKKYTGATTILPFAHVVRKLNWQQAYEAEKNLNDSDRAIATSYAQHVHIDQSYIGSYNRISYHFPHLQPLLKQHRWAVINIWRPIEYPATRDNLAVCDSRSVSEEDLVELLTIFPKQEKRRDSGKGDDPYYEKPPNGIWSVWPNEHHKWYYASEMKPEEVLMLKIFDTKKGEEGVARRVPHTAFTCEEDYGPVRQSLECRCFVMWEDEGCDETFE